MLAISKKASIIISVIDDITTQQQNKGGNANELKDQDKKAIGRIRYPNGIEP